MFGNNMRIAKIVISILQLSFLLTGCASPSRPLISQVDYGFISQQPCGPSCFENIKPGITNEQDALQILKNLKEQCAQYDHTNQGDYRGVECNRVGMDFTNHTAGVITFHPSASITTRQLIDKYGPPDRMWVYLSSLQSEEFKMSDIRLFYDRYQMTLDLTEENGPDYTINADTVVSSISYFPIHGYQDYQNLMANEVVSWKGLGTYKTGN
jgi:hypothetical protein